MRRQLFVVFCLSIGFFTVNPVQADLRPVPDTDGPEGSWEGFIAETPARLTHVRLELIRDEGSWEGTIDLPGAPGLPLSAIRTEGAELHFELQVGKTHILFDANYASTTISGFVVEGERSFTFDLQRLPVYKEPDSRIEAWRQDLDDVRSRFLEYDLSFSSKAKAAFSKSIDKLEASLPELNDQEIIVALSEAVALSGNAHTRLYLLRNRTELRRLPVRLYWFTDGLFVIRATPAYRDTLGCRVTRLAGRDPRRVRRRVSLLFAGNDSWVDYKSPYFMTSPEILYGLGMVEDMEKVTLRFDCPGRESFERAMVPLSLQRKKEPTEAWRDLSPRWPGRGGSDSGGGREGDAINWISAIPVDRPLPLYLRHPEQHYWFEYLDEKKALYLQYNRSQNMPDGMSFKDFVAQVEAIIGQPGIEMLVLDLRFNTGGNLSIAAPFMERLAAFEKKETIGKLYVITGRSTFSAGIYHAAYLKQASNATFVGEPVGDKLDTWSEGGNIVLPNSGLTVHFTNGFHSLSNIERPEFQKYAWTDLDLDNLDPDIVVRHSSDDYFSGRDPTLAAILSKVD